MQRWMTLAAAWAVGVTALLAQTPPAGQPPLGPPTAPPVAPPAVVPAAPAVDPVLWGHLQNWETVMKGAANFSSKGKVIRETKAGPGKGRRDATTHIICLMPSKARMNVIAAPGPGDKADPNDYEAYIATSNLILEYDGNNKRLTETRLPPGSTKGMLLLDFMSGAITAKAAVERFTIKLLQEDANYLYLEMQPRTKEDAGDFETMILVLFRNVPGQPAYLPRQVVIRRKNNQYEETWDFPNPAINRPGIKDADFEPVAVDKKTWQHVVNTAPSLRPADILQARPVSNTPPTGVGPAAIPGGPGVVPTPGAGPPK